ncbi:Lateral signaling target protein 2-like protein [Diplonema papillatum]|nr:Lateral signaling target protein 2-like protein [Diplonema papillatum]
MAFESSAESSDDGGLRHITLARARPAKHRRNLPGKKSAPQQQRCEAGGGGGGVPEKPELPAGNGRPAEKLGGSPRHADPAAARGDGDWDSDTASESGATDAAAAGQQQPQRQKAELQEQQQQQQQQLQQQQQQPPSQNGSAGAEHFSPGSGTLREGDAADYLSSAGPYPVVVKQVDVSVTPASYTVAFADGTERSTDRQHLRPRLLDGAPGAAPSPRFSVGDRVVYVSTIGRHPGCVKAVEGEAYVVEFGDGSRLELTDVYLVEAPRASPAASASPASTEARPGRDAAAKKEKKEKKDKKEKARSDKRAKREKRKEQQARQSSTRKDVLSPVSLGQAQLDGQDARSDDLSSAEEQEVFPVDPSFAPSFGSSVHATAAAAPGAVYGDVESQARQSSTRKDVLSPVSLGQAQLDGQDARSDDLSSAEEQEVFPVDPSFAPSSGSSVHATAAAAAAMAGGAVYGDVESVAGSSTLDTSLIGMPGAGDDRPRRKRPKPVTAPPVLTKIIPDTKIYASLVVEKISNRGFRHKRVMICTSSFVIFTKENGDVRRVVELPQVDSFLLQATKTGHRVVIRLLRDCTEPDVDFAVRAEKRVDPRNSHESLHAVVETIAAVTESSGHHRVPVTDVTPDTDLRLLMRSDAEIQKADPKKKMWDVVDVSNRERELAPEADEEDDIFMEPPKKAPPSVDDEEAPQWRPDVDVNTCEGCRKPFTMIRRRHHCRSCGGVFCAACTAQKAIIPKIGPTEVRACESCRSRVLESLRVCS